MGLDIFGLDILGLDILGLDILGTPHLTNISLYSTPVLCLRLGIMYLDQCDPV